MGSFQKLVQTSWSIKKYLKTEMALFEATGGKQMGEYLKMLFDALKNIAPTSIARWFEFWKRVFWNEGRFLSN